eukprot:12680649-Heterocapsa_arctica.AAC.1
MIARAEETLMVLNSKGVIGEICICRENYFLQCYNVPGVLETFDAFKHLLALDVPLGNVKFPARALQALESQARWGRGIGLLQGLANCI